ncbi:MAG: aldehyde dehydrogenase family protein [Candidatus Binataceae bacterium]
MAATSTIESSSWRPSAPVMSFLQGGPKKLLINGEWVPAKSGKTFETVNPATEEVLAHVAEAEQADVDEAVRAARKALEEGPWSRMQPAQRAKYLLKLADLLEAHAKELSELDTLDGGRVIALTQFDAYGAAEGLRYCAGWATKVSGETNSSGPDIFNFSIREPLGVVGIIIPWNGPAVLAATKHAMALACGNTVVLKPAEQTPLSAVRVGELMLEAGFPPGVINIITGFGRTAGAALANHPDVDGISFTGSVSTGKEILRASLGNLKRVTLELGGKSPHIIFPDSDLEAALPDAVHAIFRNQGQTCFAGSRVFVQRDMYSDFAARFAQAAAAVKVGPPSSPETTVGPVVSKAQYDRVTGYIGVGQKEGAKVAAGGLDRPNGGRGYYIKPTVFTGVDNRMRIAQEEIFGPVAALIPFKDENDAVLQGNDTIYGLGAGIWTRDISRAIRVARRIKAGMVWINGFGKGNLGSPFGGYKQSGIGRENSREALYFYTQAKAVTITL